MIQNYDVAIVGGGVVGCAIARELSKYKLATVLLEKKRDVSLDTSCRNSGVLHAGFNYVPGTVRGRLCVRGNALMDGLCHDLKVKIKRIGKLTVAVDTQEISTLHRLKAQGDANGTPGLEILNHEQMEKIQPGVEGIAALHSPSSSIISPYGLTIALAENACANGVEIRLGWPVSAITHEPEGGFKVRGPKGAELHCKVLINAAGLYSDEVCRMAGITDYRIYPCRGEYYVLDRRLNGSLSALIYPAPNPKNPGLGIHLTPTVDGNILIGPSADYQDSRDYTGCSAEVMAALRREGHALLPTIRMSDFIRNFSGLRAKRTPPNVGGNADFVIDDRKDLPGFIALIGFESPGLTSAPAAAEEVRDMVGKHLKLVPNPAFNPVRPGSALFFSERSPEERADMIADDPDYGEIICRCEHITKREVLDALNNPLGARTLVSLKYRARVTMGRCQGGFCLPRIVRLVQEDLGWNWDEFSKEGVDSPLFVGTVLGVGMRSQRGDRQ